MSGREDSHELDKDFSNYWSHPQNPVIFGANVPDRTINFNLYLSSETIKIRLPSITFWVLGHKI